MNGFITSLSIRSGISATPDFIIGLSFLATWVEPKALGENRHSYFLIIMLLEFITIHSAGFMGWAIIAGSSKFFKALRVTALGVFYSLFIWAFTVINGDLWPLAAFWLLVFNRLMTVFVRDENTAPQQIVLMASWGWSVMCYVLAIGITVVIPFPEFGWTKEIVQHMTSSGSGLWFDDPQSLFAAGFIYFTSVGIFELFAQNISAKFSDINPSIPLFRK